MKPVFEHNTLIGVELTRRNLETLLAKLDANVAAPGVSQCMIAKVIIYPHRDRAPNFFIRAVENDAHYEAEGRPAGEMHPREEAVISKPSTGVEPA